MNRSDHRGSHSDHRPAEQSRRQRSEHPGILNRAVHPDTAAGGKNTESAKDHHKDQLIHRAVGVFFRHNLFYKCYFREQCCDQYQQTDIDDQTGIQTVHKTFPLYRSDRADEIPYFIHRSCLL